MFSFCLPRSVVFRPDYFHRRTHVSAPMTVERFLASARVKYDYSLQ